MAQAVIVSSGDTMTSLLKRHHGLKDHEVYLWSLKAREINPHISDLNRIYPQERVLLPDDPGERVPDEVIWRNAFERIPSKLNRNGRANHTMYFSLAGEPIDEVALMMFADTPHFYLPLSTKRALLIHNNPFLREHLATNLVPPRTLLDVSPVRFSHMEHHFWSSQRPYITIAWDELVDPTKQLVQEAGTEQALTLAELLEQLQAVGAAIGMERTMKWTGYGVGGTSGYAASAQMALTHTQTLARELYTEAIAKFGEKTVHAKGGASLTKMQQFLTSHPKYGQLMQSLKELPRHLLPKGRILPAVNGGVPNATARHFRKTFSLPYDKWNSSRYLSSIGRRLNGNVSFVRSAGRYATWYIPAAIGIYKVATAPDELRMRTLFSEGFGIVGGAIGTIVGAKVAILGTAGLAAMFGICISPLGMFLLVFFFASAAGLYFSGRFKELGGNMYDLGDNFLNGKAINSPDQILSSL